MTCPMCQDTGQIGVNVIDGATKESRGEWRPVVPLAVGNGVGGNGSLEGNERALDYGIKRKRHIRAGHQKRALKFYTEG
jgi:hypothetical protein